MEAWATRAKELAQWTWTYLVNRTDVWGSYFDLEYRKKNPESKSWTAPAKAKRGRILLSPAHLERHFAAKFPEHVIGLHSTSPQNTCRWVGLDIDAHKESDDPEANARHAARLYDFMVSLDYTPLLTDSDGKGGFHLRVVFAEPIPADAAYYWAKQISAQCDVPCEQFPKQDHIDNYGNWMRLPGRHHTTDHYSRVWDGEDWRDGDDAIQAILNTTIHAAPKVDVPVKIIEPDIGAEYDAEVLMPEARRCVEALNPDIDYDRWLRVGMALHHISDASLPVWESWSAKGSKYKSGECGKKWASFSGSNGKQVGIGTLMHYAREAGVIVELPKLEIGTSWQIGADLGKGEATPPAAAPPPEPETTDDPKPLKYDKSCKRQRVANVDDRFTMLKSGRETTSQIYIPLPSITQNALRTMQGWPATCGGQLFSVKHTKKPIYPAKSVTWIRNYQHLFAWYGQHADIRWCGGEAENDGQLATPVTKQEFFEHLLHNSRTYDSIESLPHEPLVADTYYMPCELPEVDINDPMTPLKQLIEMFNPDTEMDRFLLFAALMTPGWGGRSGSRPAFVFTSTYGKGVGKSQTAQVIGHLWGGYVLFKADEDVAEFCARLLDSESVGKRVIVLDNMKGRKSDANLEMLLTTDSINAKKMYVGTRFIPNRFTWIITANTPQLSSDLTVRSVVIQLGKQKYGGRDFHTRACSLINENRGEILSELFAYMRRPKHPPVKYPDRWAAWQEDILGVFPDPEGMAKAIIERRPAVDSDNSNADDVACEIRKYINGQYPDRADLGVFFITRKQLMKLMIFTELSMEKYGLHSVNAWIRGLIGSENLKPLHEYRYKQENGWRWIGKDADPTDEPLTLLDPVRETV